MSKEAKIASAAGISVGGRGPGSEKVHDAMRSVVLSGHAAGEDPAETKRRMLEARYDAKPPERR